MDKLLVTIKSTSAETKAPNGSFSGDLVGADVGS